MKNLELKRLGIYGIVSLDLQNGHEADRVIVDP